MLGEVLIVGSGVTGCAVLEYLARTAPHAISSFTLVGGKNAHSLKRPIETEIEGRILLETDEIPAPCSGALYDVAVVSPGVAPHTPLYQEAKRLSRRLISEVELAYLEAPNNWIAITGTNGKTTTTSLVAHMLNALGEPAAAAGNIGLPLIEVVGKQNPSYKNAKVEKKHDGKPSVSASSSSPAAMLNDSYAPNLWIVAELSSYQLQNTFDFHPRIACLLNLAPDHLAWHNTFKQYREAKERIFQNMSATDYCVVGIDDVYTSEIAQRLAGEQKNVCFVTTQPPEKRNIPEEVWDQLSHRASIECVSDSQHAIVVHNGTRFDLGQVEDLPLKGDHNLQNMLCASSIVIAALSEDHVNFQEKLRKALRSFSPLEHRIEEVGSVGDTVYINDSKATNFASTCVALKALKDQHVVLLLGGHDKGISLDSETLDILYTYPFAIVCFGEAGPRLKQEIEDGHARRSRPNSQRQLQKNVDTKLAPAVSLAGSLEEAVKCASSIKDVPQPSCVLLSPGCSSFDEFASFEERGAAFKDIVARLQKAQ